jgi:hypothetical protein
MRLLLAAFCADLRAALWRWRPCGRADGQPGGTPVDGTPVDGAVPSMKLCPTWWFSRSLAAPRSAACLRGRLGSGAGMRAAARVRSNSPPAHSTAASFAARAGECPRVPAACDRIVSLQRIADLASGAAGWCPASVRSR